MKKTTVALLFVLMIFAFDAIFLTYQIVKNVSIAQIQDLQTNIITVCPSQELGYTDCDFRGGEGVQQAVDSVPIGSNEKTKIILKKGPHHRQNYTIAHSKFAPIKIRKCMVAVTNKNIDIVGDGIDVLGEQSDKISGVCVESGSVKITNLHLAGLMRESTQTTQSFSSNCKTDDNGSQLSCSYGSGVDVLSSGNVSVEDFITIGKSGYGVYVADHGIFLHNSVVSKNNIGIGSIDNTKISLINNTIVKNRYSGILILYKAQMSPVIDRTIKNNIIARTQDRTLSNEGFGIWKSQATLAPFNMIDNDYNLHYGNTRGACAPAEPCNGTGIILDKDPEFTDPDVWVYKLKNISPAPGASVPTIVKLDGTRSDIGWDGVLIDSDSPTPTHTSQAIVVSDIPNPTVSQIDCPLKSVSDASCDGGSIS